MIDLVKVGTRISQNRKRARLSQDALAEKLYVTRQALSKWENGLSAPSLEALAEMSRMFGVSFEEILGLSEPAAAVDEENIFAGKDRAYVVTKIASGELEVNVPDVLYQMSPGERIYILKAIKAGRIFVDMESLWPRLTPSEQKYLGGMEYEIH